MLFFVAMLKRVRGLNYLARNWLTLSISKVMVMLENRTSGMLTILFA